MGDFFGSQEELAKMKFAFKQPKKPTMRTLISFHLCALNWRIKNNHVINISAMAGQGEKCVKAPFTKESFSFRPLPGQCAHCGPGG